MDDEIQATAMKGIVTRCILLVAMEFRGEISAIGPFGRGGMDILKI
jgi:hypothetical protein